MIDHTAAMENTLRRTAAATTYPSAPPLAARVRARLEARPAPRPLYRFPRPQSVAGIALVASVFIAALLVLSTGTRDAVADFFGLEHFRFFRADETTVPPARTDGAATSPPFVGTPVAIDEAQRAVAFPLRFPTGLGEPRELLVQRFVSRVGVVSFHRMPDGRELILLQTQGMIGKSLFHGATAETQPVGGIPGLWLQGQRLVAYLDDAGRPADQSVRVTNANTLVWERNGVIYRLEGNLSRDEAVRMAESTMR